MNLNEEFPTLHDAPVIEAVIHWQAHANKTLNPEILKHELTQRLPDYPICQPQQNVEIAYELSGDTSSEVRHRSRWDGFRLQNVQNHHVVQFTQTGVIFSNLEPYETWDVFQAEALRLWHLFLELAEPTVIQKLGIRYINRILLEIHEQPSTYLRGVPSNLPGLDLSPEFFFHKEDYQVPHHPYRISLARTIQPPQMDPQNQDKAGLIIDIDVFTTELLQLDQDNLIHKLQEMRWLKNKVFFSSITEVALARFGASSYDNSHDIQGK